MVKQKYNIKIEESSFSTLRRSIKVHLSKLKNGNGGTYENLICWKRTPKHSSEEKNLVTYTYIFSALKQIWENF